MRHRLRPLLRWYGLLAFAALVAPAAMLVLAAGLAFVLRRQALWRAWLAAPHWSSLGWGVLGGLSSTALVLLLYLLSPRFAAALAESSVRTAADAVERFGWVAMLVIGTTAALGEESLFRGALQPSIGIALAAVLFGLAHGGWRRQMWAYAVAAALAGLVFGHLYAGTGDLWAAIIAHAAHNAGAIALVALGIYPEPEAEPAAEVRLPMSRPTLRELGATVGALPPGPCNAITDVPGVSVGHCTVWSDPEPDEPGRGPWRTGVTAVLPHSGDLCREKVPAGLFVLNGYGKATGLAQVEESGALETPVLLTGTLSVFRAADALITWMIGQNPDLLSVNPVVLECNDGYLSDARSRPVGEAEVRAALAAAAGGPVQQGVVGAGTGMRAFGYKGGIGTASRRVASYTLGVLVLANFGQQEQLLVLGEPMHPSGRYGALLAPESDASTPPATDSGASRPPATDSGGSPAGEAAPPPEREPGPEGSCVVVVATDAPMDARQLRRLARRAALGIARTGGTGHNTSGDFCLAFSTAYRIPRGAGTLHPVALLADADPATDALFDAAVEATEEAILNALFCAVTVAGREGRIVRALPAESVLARLRFAGRL